MAEPKRRQRPKGAELRASLKSKDRFTDRDIETVNKITQRLKEPAAAGALGAVVSPEDTDPFFSRNEFKPGFYTQKDQPPITAETMYGKGTKRTLESPIVDPDTSMMQGMAQGGSVRGQKNIQVKKKPFRGIF